MLGQIKVFNYRVSVFATLFFLHHDVFRHFRCFQFLFCHFVITNAVLKLTFCGILIIMVKKLILSVLHKKEWAENFDFSYPNFELLFD